jgi:predicted MFS family arabinose efflux permease
MPVHWVSKDDTCNPPWNPHAALTPKWSTRQTSTVSDTRQRFGLLHEPDFRKLFASTITSQFALRVTALAVPLVAILTLEVDPFQVGLLTACATAAHLLVGLPAGAWVDRARRRTVLINAFLAQSLILATVPIAYWAGVLTIWQLYAVALLSGTCGLFQDVAQQSYLPKLVGRDNLLEANTKLQGVRAIVRMAGPGAVGQVILVLTAPFALVINVVSLLLSSLLIGGIQQREDKPSRPARSSLRREIAEGLRFVLGHRLLRPIAACNAMFNFAWAAYGAMLMVFLVRDLGLSPALIGVFFMFAGVGGVLGVSVNRRVVSIIGQGRAIWVAPAASSPFLLLVPFAQPGPTTWIAACGYFLVSVGQVIYNVTQVSFRQRLTPEQLLGRMSATMRFLVWGVMPLGALAGGVVGQWLGVRHALLIAGVLGALAFVPIFLSPLRRMRDLPSAPEEHETPAGVTR